MNLFVKFMPFMATVLCSLALASPLNAETRKVNWEILIDSDVPGTFYANIGGEIISGFDGMIAAPVPGSTYFLRGDLYPLGTIDPNTLDPEPDQKIGEWYCTGTRVVSPGGVFEEANVTFRLNDGSRIMTKYHVLLDFTPPLGFSIDPSAVLFSSVDGVKAGDTLNPGNPANAVFLRETDRDRTLIRGITRNSRSD